MSYQNILVGVDGSKQADMAFEKAVDTAKTNDAKLYLLSIINVERYPSTGPGGYGFVVIAFMIQQLKRCKRN